MKLNNEAVELVLEQLNDHRYQELQHTILGEQPTVCSCGMSPVAKPVGDDGDYVWWLTHIKQELQSHEHEWSPIEHDQRWVWCRLCFGARKDG